jgi:hypothetical protein
LKWAELVVGIGETRNTYTILGGKLKEADNLRDLGVNGSILLNLVFDKGEIVEGVQLE